MRLRHIVYESFCYSEQTLMNEYIKANKDMVKTFRLGDVVLFVSLTGTQMKFVYNWDKMGIERDGESKDVSVLASRNYRIQGTTWDPKMLGEYAYEAGIELEGAWIKRFKEAFDEQHG